MLKLNVNLSFMLLLFGNVKDKTCGIKWNIIQIKLYSLQIPAEYSFIDSEDEAPDYKNDPKYKKYFDMLKKEFHSLLLKTKNDITK